MDSLEWGLISNISSIEMGMNRIWEVRHTWEFISFRDNSEWFLNQAFVINSY